MTEEKKPIRCVAVIQCHVTHERCTGVSCATSFAKREHHFSAYGDEVEYYVPFTCGGCPGGNIEYAPEEMKKNGVSAIHFATGMIVGYPPCPRIKYFSEFIQEKYGIDVVFGTHPIPEKYYRTHSNLKTWDSKLWEKIIEPVLCDEKTRLSYD